MCNEQITSSKHKDTRKNQQCSQRTVAGFSCPPRNGSFMQCCNVVVVKILCSRPRLKQIADLRKKNPGCTKETQLMPFPVSF